MLPMILLDIGFSLFHGPATTTALTSFGNRAGTVEAIYDCTQMSGAVLLVALMLLLF